MFNMIWTLQTITIFMAIMSNVSTLSYRRIKRESDLKYQIDHVPNDNGESTKNVSEVLIYHNIDQNLTSNIGHNSNEVFGIDNVSAVNISKPIVNFEKKNTEKLEELQEGIKPSGDRGKTLGILHSGLFKSMGADTENFPIISDQNAFGMTIKNYKIGDITNPPWKNHPLGGKILSQQNDHFNRRKIDKLSFLDFVSDGKKSKVSINSSRDYVHSSDDLITTRTVFPEEQYNQDVLAAVQKESFHGFPKGKNQYFITIKNNETSPSNSSNHSLEINSDLNPIVQTEKYNDTMIGTLNTGEVYVGNDEKSFTTENSTVSLMSLVDEIKEVHVPATKDHRKSSSMTEAATLRKKLESENYMLKKLAYQQKEDDIRIHNAKYEFSTSQKDGISDLLHDRTETRQDGKVTGSYTYSDGFLLRKVNYVADKNGYRIVSDEMVPLPGNGPKVNPNGTAHIKSEVAGHPVHYIVHGRHLPNYQRSSPHQGKGKL